MEKFTFNKLELCIARTESGFIFCGGDIYGIKIKSSPLFTLRGKDTVTNKDFSLDSQTGWGIAHMEREDKKTICILSDHLEFPELTIKVMCEEQKSSACLEVEVENNNINCSVMEITYPVPAFEGEYFDVFFPRASGCVTKDAGNKGFVYGNHYPSHSACMQYFSIYNGKGGLYIGLEDPTAATKKFGVRAKENEAQFHLLFYAPGGGNPGNSFKIPGVCRLEAFEGDWYEASLLYARFVKEKCDWLPKLGESGREDIPERFKNIPFWVSDYMPNSPYQRENKPANLSAGSDIYARDYWIKAVLELKEKLNVDLAYHVYNWHNIPFNIEYPHFLPAKDEFIAGAEMLRQEGIAILPYINAVSWEMDDAEANHEMNFENTGIQGAPINEAGEVIFLNYPQTTISGKTSRLVPICPDFTLWHDYMQKLSRDMNSTLPIDGIYFDEIAAHESHLCCNKNHSHAPYGGSYWVEGYRSMMAKINGEKSADKYYFTECNAEPYVNSFDGFLTWMWIHGNQVPAFSAVYAGYIQLIGRCTIGTKKEDFEFFKHSVASCLHYGQIMGWCKADILYSQKHMEFLPPYVKLREKYCAFFQNAEMKKPPVVKCDLPDKVTSPGLWFRDDVIMPQVSASHWQNRHTKEQVLFLTNIAEVEAKAEIIYKKDGVEQTLDMILAPYECCAIELGV